MKFIPTLFFWQVLITSLCFLSIGSLILRRQYKEEKSLVFYALYTLLLLLYFILVSPYNFAWQEAVDDNLSETLIVFIEILYSSSFLLFFLYFIDVKIHFNQLYNFTLTAIGIGCSLASIMFIVAFYTKNYALFIGFYSYVFLPLYFCFSLYILSKIFQLPKKFNYYFIAGTSIYLGLIVLDLLFPLTSKFLKINKVGLLFYVGVLGQQVAYSIGIIAKLKLQEQEKRLQIKHKIIQKEVTLQKAPALENPVYQLHLLSLQNQMNPHFIFNALNSIKVFLIENKKKNAVYYLNKFSKLIRHILGSTQVESISLLEELSILELYVAIENIRFEDKVNFKISNPEKINLKSIMLPAMFLQPFIENAIWHGLALQKEKKSIDIIFMKNTKHIVMKIRDNGIGREKSKQRLAKKSFQNKAMGLQINHQRLDYFNQKKGFNYSFQIKDLKNKNGKATGTEVEMVFA